MHSKYGTGNHSITRKWGHWPASEDIMLPFLTYYDML